MVSIYLVGGAFLADKSTIDIINYCTTLCSLQSKEKIQKTDYKELEYIEICVRAMLDVFQDR